MLLLLVGIALSGVMLAPAKSQLALGKTTERFPCENCPCGCASAEFCWDHCCCHNDREKLQWATENGVMAPRFLVERFANAAPTESTTNPGMNPDASSAALSCCCCATNVPPGAPETSPTSRRREATCPPNSHVAKQQLNQQDTSLVLMWKVAECRGIKMLWTVLAQAYVDPAPPRLTTLPSIVEWLHLSDETAESRLLSPEPPIP